jgi:hypothetical protein
MIEIFREIKDTPTPSLLVAGGMIFLVLAVAGRIIGKVEVPPQHQRTAGAIGVLLLLGGIALQMAPVLLRPPASDPLPVAAGGTVDTSPPAANTPATALPTAVPPTPTSLPTAVPPAPTSLPTAPPATATPPLTESPPTAQPIPTTPPAPPGRSPEDSLRDYWRAVSERV